MAKNIKDALVNMINNDMLDWELVGREMLTRMSMDEVEDMIFECDWEDDECIRLANRN
jgi:hypothetical protein